MISEKRRRFVIKEAPFRYATTETYPVAGFCRSARQTGKTTALPSARQFKKFGTRRSIRKSIFKDARNFGICAKPGSVIAPGMPRRRAEGRRVWQAARPWEPESPTPRLRRRRNGLRFRRRRRLRAG